MRRTASLVVSVLLAAPLLAGCGDDDTPASDGASSTQPLVITVTVDGDTVEPNGDRVDATVGQPIQLAVTADAPGEIHVHSTPDQEYEYEAGSTTLDLVPIERPGIVDIESHTLDKTIVQLQVQ